VWNLVANAIKFTPAGGRVTVALGAADHELRLSVRDTGIGFSPEVAAHLFERFRQGDSSPTRQHGGLGLGLGIVRHVVELHGGTVTASSAGDDRGSRFDVCLPMRVMEMPAAGPRQTPGRLSLRGVSVLVVDHDEEALAFVRTTLERHGANVMTASSPTEAKARFRQDPPDVLLSDLVLPDEDGLALIREIRELDRGVGRATPAGALTALARAEDRRRALVAGYQIHVAKPVAPSELVSTVEWLVRAAPLAVADRN
jgi:CheY-like chemotaxis protein